MPNTDSRHCHLGKRHLPYHSWVRSNRVSLRWCDSLKVELVSGLGEFAAGRSRTLTVPRCGSATRGQPPIHSFAGNVASLMSRLSQLRQFYRTLGILEERLGGVRRLSQCTGRMSWPRRGVYFFMESGEVRTDTGQGLRVVRVGTHALNAGSKTKLWDRLATHRGSASIKSRATTRLPK